MLRTDGKSRTERKVGKVKILGNPPDHEPGTLPVFQPFTQETMEHGAAGVESLQRILVGESLEDIIRGTGPGAVSSFV